MLMNKMKYVVFVATKRDMWKNTISKGLPFCLHHPQENCFEYILKFYISFTILVWRIMKKLLKCGLYNTK